MALWENIHQTPIFKEMCKKTIASFPSLYWAKCKFSTVELLEKKGNLLDITQHGDLS